MEGFGVHTFRPVDADGASSLVKFHWKPVAGVHSLVWEEAQLAAGTDPDFHRRDMADAIDAGAFFEYELGIQVMPDSDDETFEGIDLLDPTKLVPEERVPVQPVAGPSLHGCRPIRWPRLRTSRLGGCSPVTVRGPGTAPDKRAVSPSSLEGGRRPGWAPAWFPSSPGRSGTQSATGPCCRALELKMRPPRSVWRAHEGR